MWKAGQACQSRQLRGAVQLWCHWATLLACSVQTPCPLKATPANAQLTGQGFPKAFPDLAMRNHSLLWNVKACGLYFSEKFLSHSGTVSFSVVPGLSTVLRWHASHFLASPSILGFIINAPFLSKLSFYLYQNEWSYSFLCFNQFLSFLFMSSKWPVWVSSAGSYVFFTCPHSHGSHSYFLPQEIPCWSHAFLFLTPDHCSKSSYSF